MGAYIHGLALFTEKYCEAQVNLGVLFNEGKGVAESDEEAVKWFRLAAAQGNTDAVYYLRFCYEYGHGVPQDLQEVLRLYKRAMTKGHPDAAAQVEKLEALMAAEHGR
ncbi:hypothetical protein M885DRAFT_560896 [Pelagophyceae sp. CCMP2097]|nr:hypothetical protein M885DRAFT_560896 [Pelagophyceae sp. CCMP2097]